MLAPASALTAEAIADRVTTAPRYTSYPPATAFTPVPPTLAVDELARLGREQRPVSLYVHVPFCRSLCAYCGCNVTISRAVHRGEGYVDALATEMVRIAAGLGRAPVTEVALGGGSPNFLTPAALTNLADALDRYFAITPDARRSVELDPRATTPEQVDLLAARGWNSLSVGVQDFDPEVQSIIGRIQSVEETRP
jgi:oxygen-independent coproporphyrinogen-3 oxidase